MREDPFTERLIWALCRPRPQSQLAVLLPPRVCSGVSGSWSTALPDVLQLSTQAPPGKVGNSLQWRSLPCLCRGRKGLTFNDSVSQILSRVPG